MSRQPPINGLLNTPELLQAYLDSCPHDLTHLNLKETQIVSLVGAKFPHNLKDLDLRHNHIFSLEISLFPATLVGLDLRGNPINKEEADRLSYIVNTPGYNDDTGVSFTHPLAANDGLVVVGGMKSMKSMKTRKTRKTMKTRKTLKTRRQ